MAVRQANLPALVDVAVHDVGRSETLEEAEEVEIGVELIAGGKNRNVVVSPEEVDVREIAYVKADEAGKKVELVRAEVCIAAGTLAASGSP